MKLHRFFVAEALSGKVGEQVRVLDRDLVHQWKTVLRLNIGGMLILLDNSGFEYLCQITAFEVGRADVLVLEARRNQHYPKREVKLFLALIKKDKLEWVFEKGTELGVSQFFLVLSERSEKKSWNRVRAEKIVKEAAEQSGRGVLPVLHEPISLEAAVSDSGVPNIVLHPGREKISARDVETRFVSSASIFIGPEGGWSDREVKLFESKTIPIFSIGKNILRAETAAVAIAALLLI